MRNYAGKILTTNLMKSVNQLCPWQTRNDLNNYKNIKYTTYQKLMGCTCPTSSACNGFCTFPVSGVLYNCNGIAWDKTGNQDYYVLSGLNTEFSYKLIA
jgi:hypothetical protein